MSLNQIEYWEARATELRLERDAALAHEAKLVARVGRLRTGACALASGKMTLDALLRADDDAAADGGWEVSRCRGCGAHPTHCECALTGCGG